MEVGDKVKVLGIFGIDKIDHKYVGAEGIIDRIDTSSNYPYRVKFDSYQNNQFREDELQLINKEETLSREDIPDNISYPPKGALIEVREDYYITDLRGLIGHVIDDYGGVVFKQADLNGLHNLNSEIPTDSGRYFHISEVYLVTGSNHPNNKKEENMNKDLEQIIKEGDMAMKLVGSVKASPTTIAYTEDITSTLGTLKKKDKRVGFVSTPLKNTI